MGAVIRPRDPRGIGLATVFLTIAVVVVVMLAITTTNQSTLRTTAYVAHEVQAFYLSEAGVRVFLSSGEQWKELGEKTFQLNGGQVTLEVKKGSSNGLAVKSTGKIGKNARSIVLSVTKDGFVQSRREQ